MFALFAPKSFFVILSLLATVEAPATDVSPPDTLVAPAPARVAKELPAPALTPAPITVAPAVTAPVVADEPTLAAPTPAPAPGFFVNIHADAFSDLMVAQAPTAVAVVDKVQAFYNSTKDFKANFSQEVKNSTFNRLAAKKNAGYVYIKKPGMMRWDYKHAAKKGKYSKSFLSDGKHMWAVLHQNKQYYKESLADSTLPVAVSFLMGKGDLKKDFKVAFDSKKNYGKKGDHVLVLTPKKPSARYKKLWLIVNPSDYSVRESVVLNSKGDTNHIRFSGAKKNSNLKNGVFLFNAKAHKDYRLVEAPKGPGPGTAPGNNAGNKP